MKKNLTSVVLILLLCFMSSCGNETASNGGEESKGSIESASEAEAEKSKDNTSLSSESAASTEDISVTSEPVSIDHEIDIDPAVIQKIPEEFMDISLLDDGNYYIMVQTVSGDNVFIREFATKGENVFANTREKDFYQWFYSDGKATFSFDDENKTYEIYDINPLFVNFFSDTIISTGDCVFFDIECKYTRYSLGGETSIMHLFRKSDNSWVGFQYMYGEQYEDANIILTVSDAYPEYAMFEIPSDYSFYFEEGDNVASMNWD